MGLGLALGFLHPHGNAPRFSMIPTWIYIFIFVAVPEELFFRAWVQNLLERRVGRRAALGITALLFGLSHFNKRSAHFNWRYVLLASVAGIFYGRAWREQRRVPASAITHASVDAIWSFWFYRTGGHRGAGTWPIHAVRNRGSQNVKVIEMSEMAVDKKTVPAAHTAFRRYFVSAQLVVTFVFGELTNTAPTPEFRKLASARHRGHHHCDPRPGGRCTRTLFVQSSSLQRLGLGLPKMFGAASLCWGAVWQRLLAWWLW